LNKPEVRDSIFGLARRWYEQDKETQQLSGDLLRHAKPQTGKPNEVYFLQAIGDQMFDEREPHALRVAGAAHGRFGRAERITEQGSYLSCLLTEADRARTQGDPAVVDDFCR